MIGTPSANSTIPEKYGIPVLLTLIIAGLAGNYFRFPLFHNLDFLFGSIFALLALQLFGPGRGILAAAIIAGSTYLFWNHPYAIIIMAAEVAVVGWLMKRRRMGMVPADALYWLIIGMPLVYLFYHGVMHVPHSNTYIVMTKQAVNGIANALAARLIFTGYALFFRTSLISYREIVCNLLAFFVLCPTLVLLTVDSRSDFNKTDRQIRAVLLQDSRHVAHSLETWVLNRKSAMTVLAEMAASRSPQQMQPFLEQAARSDANFLRIGLLDSHAITTAFFPQVDELGQPTIGKNFADRPFIPLLRQTLKPLLSEVVMGKIGTPRPLVSMLAPVVMRGEYGGYVIGVLDMGQIREHLDKSTDQNATYCTLIDKNGNVIMTNRSDQALMKPFVRGNGTLNRLEDGISQWLPFVPANTPISERWKQSFYVAETAIGQMAEWKLILEQPVAPFQKALNTTYTGKLSLLFLILLGSLALAEFFSRRTIVTFDKLRLITRDLPARLAADTNVVWPESGIAEAHHLVENFKRMADSLSEQFIEIRQINESLEQRVTDRTQELRESRRFTLDVLNSLTSNIAVLDNSGKIVTVNESWQSFARENSEPMMNSIHVGKNYLKVCRDSIGSEDDQGAKAACTGISAVLRGELDYFSLEYPCHSPREQRWFVMNVTMLRGSRDGVVVSHTNITERKQAENALRTSDERLIMALEAARSANSTMSRLLGIVAHEFRTPLGLLTGSADILDRYWDRLTPEKRSEQNEHIRSAVQQMSNLINAVIAFNQRGADRVVNLPLQLDIGSVCRTIAAEVETVWGSGHKFYVMIAEDCGTALLDEMLFRRILENLLTNAFRYTPSGGTVSLYVRREKQQLLLEIFDSGIGIPEEDQSLIFDAFYRSRNVEGRRGLGLGLSIVHESLSQMGGTISVTSTPGEGTAMRVELPVFEPA